MLVGKKSTRDKNIHMDVPTHVYYLNGKPVSRSASGVIAALFPKFDAEAQARRLVEGKFKGGKNAEKYKELTKNAKTNDECVAILKKSWADNGSESAALGTDMHESIEDFYRNGTTLPDTKESKMFMAFHDHATSLGYVPYRSEQIVYDEEYDIAGSADMLYIHKDDLDISPRRLWLVDWKRSKDISTHGFGQNGTGPMSGYANCNHSKYGLQLNIYKYMLEKNYVCEITRMSLVILHPNQKNYELHDMCDMGDTAERCIAYTMRK